MLSIFRKTIVFLGLGCALVWCAPRYVTTVSGDELQSKIRLLDDLRKQSEGLSSEKKAKLDAIWEEAQQIERMNDRCREISLNEVPEEDCQTFYAQTLPRFETEFFKITGEIRLGGARLANSVEEQRKAIQACFDALQIEAFHPSRFYQIDAEWSVEPLQNGVEISYDFSLKPQYDVKERHESLLKDWYDACYEIVSRKDGSDFTPIFKDAIENSQDRAGKVNGALYFTGYLQGGIVNLAVITRDGISGTYSVNNKKLFKFEICSETTIMEIRISPYGSKIEMISGDSWNGKENLGEREIQKGISGHLAWEDGASRRCGQTELTPKSSYDNDYHSDYGSSSNFHSSLRSHREEPSRSAEPEDESQLSNPENFLGIQMLLGINVSFMESNETLEDIYGYHSSSATDSATFILPYIAVELTLAPAEFLAMSVGAGVAWTFVNISNDSDKGLVYRSSVSPMVVGELNFGTDVSVGPRCIYVFDDKEPAIYLSGFIELANLFSVDIGWFHAQDNAWNNLYVGFALRLLPRWSTQKQ